MKYYRAVLVEPPNALVRERPQQSISMNYESARSWAASTLTGKLPGSRVDIFESSETLKESIVLPVSPTPPSPPSIPSTPA